MPDAAVVLVLILAASAASCGGIEPVTGRSAGSPSQAPEVARVVCHKDGSTELLTDSVAAQSDGVHVEVDNRSGEGAQIIGLGTDVSAGMSTVVTAVPPGRVQVACYPYSRHEDPAPKGLDFAIEDPNGYWVSIELECPPGDMVASVINDFFGDASGQTGDPVDLARENLRGLKRDDIVERAAYPESDDATVRVVRDEDVVAIAGFHRPDAGGWNMGSVDSCDSSGIRSH